MSDQPFLPMLSPLPVPILVPPPNIDQLFEGFWKEYPRHVGKGQARRAYRKALQITDPATIILALRRFCRALQYRGTEQQFICHASTWLNGERWSDEYPDVPDEGGVIGGPGPNINQAPRGRADAIFAAGIAAGARVRDHFGPDTDGARRRDRAARAAGLGAADD